MPQRDDDALATYLNDHLAGSVAALQLMGRICEQHTDCNLGRLMAELRADVEAEQVHLRELLAAMDKSESQVAQTIAWVGERLTRLKLGTGEHDDSGLMLFEALEALLLGFTGRRALWCMLHDLRDQMPLPLDFDALAARASDHITRLEVLRLSTGRLALQLAPTASATAS